MANTDRLDEAWRKLGSIIKNKEAELEDLRRKFQVLEEARILVVSDTSSDASSRYAAQNVPASLKDAVLQYIHSLPGDQMVTAAATTEAMRKRGLGGKSKSNSFYSGVYVTLLRLTKSGDIRSAKGTAGRMFGKSDRTASLFKSGGHQ